jgi:hypothetical protein
MISYQNIIKITCQNVTQKFTRFSKFKVKLLPLNTQKINNKTNTFTVLTKKTMSFGHMTPHSLVKYTEVPKKYGASIFRLEQFTPMKHTTRCHIVEDSKIQTESSFISSAASTGICVVKGS